MKMIYNIIFTIISIYILVKAVAYGMYEKREKNNTFGSVSVFAFSLIAVIFSNIMIWMH